MDKNRLYFGDNLDILKELYHEYPQGFIDLIYIDPPFNSKRNYNILFEDVDMEDTKAQKEAFADTWSNVKYIDELKEIQDLDLNIFRFLSAIDEINISKGAVSYLTTMALRLWYMHKLLKETGSFYLHCDPTMSHYIKVICDLIFGPNYFRNEIIWHYRTGNIAKHQFQRKHDVILFYSKSNQIKFNPIEIKEYYSQVYGPEFKPSFKGRKHGVDKYGAYRMSFVDSVWDISAVFTLSKEHLDYPTQKPLVLMDRIIKASSNEGDLVADFFCGCGTTIAAAEKLNRKWLGVDISHLAVKLITKRLIDSYGSKIRKKFEIFGFPKDLASAKELASGANGGRLKFEEWIIEVMLHGVLNPRRTETGYDGYMTFDAQTARATVLIEVKSGNANLTQLNHFIRTVENKNANMGLFVCFEEQVTSGMKKAAKQQGYFNQDQFGSQYDKIQIITVEDLLDHKQPNIPASLKGTFKTAKKETKEKDTQQKMF